jgi:hypothetical protein
MSKTKEIFDTMDKLTEQYCFVRFFADIHKDEDGQMKFKGDVYENIYMMAGMMDEDLLNEAFHEFEPEVEQEGSYTIKALLYYSKAQIGNYPPPNIEVPPHCEIQHIEFKLECTKVVTDEFSRIFEEYKDDFKLPKL